MIPKKFLSAFMVVAFIFTMVLGPIPMSYANKITVLSDIEGHWAQERIGKWVGNGLIAGYQDGSFKPDQEISRAEFVTLANKAFKKQDCEARCNFSDVKSGDWFYQEVAAAKVAGYISGYPDGTFRPGQAITRQEAAVLTAQLMNLTGGNQEASGVFQDNGRISAWARDGVNAVAVNKIMTGYPDGTFRPDRLITRAEAVATLDNALSRPVDLSELAIKGTVTGNGQPVQGATIKLFAAKGREILQETLTDRNGRYRLVVPAGEYDLLAEDQKANVGYVSGVNVAAGSSSVTDLALTRGAIIKGRLLDKNGQALTDVKVVFTANPTNVGITDSKGNFAVVLPVIGQDGRRLVYTCFFEYQGVRHELFKDRQFSGDTGLGDLRTSVGTASSGGGGGGGTTPADTTAPVWSSVYPKIAQVSENGFNLLLQTNEAGKAYYVVLAAGTAAPSATEVKSGTGSGGSEALKAGQVGLTANTEATTTINGLAASTTYDIYVVAEDAVPNLQSTPVKVAATTADPLPADTTAPVLTAAIVKNAELTLTYNEPLDAASIPASGDFMVKVKNINQEIIKANITGSSVTLTLAVAVSAGDVVTISYTPGTQPLQDGAGNKAAALVNHPVTNNSSGQVITPPGYTTPPQLQTASVDGSTATLFYNEYLDAASVPADSDFTVLVNGATRSLTYVSITGSTVLLGLETSVQAGDNVTVSYTPGANPIQDREGNLAEAFSGQPASNVMAVLVVPELNRTAVTSFVDSTAFLYTGDNPIQTGVAPGTIEPDKAAVLRGKVLSRDGQPIAGVQVNILGQTEFGSTLTRADGMFDLVTNGGTSIAINYIKDGYLTVQRHVDVPLQDYVWLPDVVLIGVDNKVTPINLAAGGMQVAQGNPVTDADGARQATLLFPEGTAAEMELPDGSTQPLTNLNVRLTEYTIGDNGPEAMPGELPAIVGYTYALEYTVDEAVAAGAGNVRFNRPVYHYNENFLNFPVGGIVPVGYYDRDRGEWISTTNGRIVQILSINEEGLAELDVDGSGVTAGAAALAALDIDEAERQKLAGLYQPGQSFWRVPITHFTPYDYNWPFGPPEDATPPNVPPPQEEADESEPCEGEGSIIEYQNQVLGEVAKVFGTPFQLNYRSNRVFGHKNQLYIPLTSDSLPDSLKTVKLEIVWMGKRFSIEMSEPQPDSWYRFLVDSQDAYGRPVQGGRTAGIKVGYTYDGVYMTPQEMENSFGQSGGAPLSFNETRQEVTLWQNFNAQVGGWDALPLGLGGWTLDVHHAHDPTTNTLYLGDGHFRQLDKFRGNQNLAGPLANAAAEISTVETDNTQLTPAVADVAVGSDGSLYVAALCTVYKVKDGKVSIVAGSPFNPETGHSGDGVPATEAEISGVFDIVASPGGGFYISEIFNRVVRKVDNQGIITTVAGTGEKFSGDDNTGDGGPAIAAQLYVPSDLALGPDGCLYIADAGAGRVRRVDQNGIITTVAGTGEGFFEDDNIGDGGPATEAHLNAPGHIAFGSDGSLYIANTSSIRKVDPQGIINTIAGEENLGFSGDGGLALAATFDSIMGLTVGPDDSLYIADGHRIRRIGRNEIINTVVGTGQAGYSGDGGPPEQAQLNLPLGIDFGPDGSLYIVDSVNYCIRKVASSTPGIAFTDNIIPSADGQEVYIFDGEGRHLRTVHALTGADRYRFAYDGAGRLQSITDGDGNVTEIERDAAGNPMAIVAPGGQRTGLSVNAKGFLNAIICPLDYATQLQYAGDTDLDWSTQDGLLTQLTDHKNNVYSFTYDENNKLTLDQDPAGGSTSLMRTKLDNGYQVAATNGIGQVTTYRVQRFADGGVTRTNTFPGGLQSVTTTGANGNKTTNFADGTRVEVVNTDDPLWGAMVPHQKVTITTPGGLTATTTENSLVELGDSNSPLDLKTLTYTVTEGDNTYSTTYDAVSMTITTVTPEGRQVVYTIDIQGRIVKEEIAGQLPIVYSYNEKGKLVTIQQGGRSWQLEYDDRGNLITATDSLEQRTSYEYNGADLLIKETLPGGRVIDYWYDINGQITAITPPGRSAHSFTYTPIGRKESYSPPAGVGIGGSQTFTYNTNRQLTSAVLGGQMVSYGYDQAGRLSSLTFPGGEISYVYDEAGRLKTITTGDEVQSRSYDGFLLTGVTISGSAAGTLGWGYTNDFNVAYLEVNKDRIEYEYDRDDMLTRVGDLTITRNVQDGAPEETALGGATTMSSYNDYGELTNFEALFANSPLYSEQLTYDDLGRATEKLETVINNEGGSDSYRYTYRYDTAGRLEEVKLNNTLVAGYSYDDNDNRVVCTGLEDNVVAVHDAQDRLTQYGNISYTYRADGSLQSKVDDQTATSYDYDVFGRLRSVTLPDDTSIDYILDGKGRRVGKKKNGTLVQGLLYQDELRPVAELDADNNIISRFIYGTKANVPDYMEKDGNTYRIISDHLGSPRLVVDTVFGEVYQRMDYDAFGNIIRDTNPGFQPFGFAGGIYDPDTGLTRFGARDYDAGTGRWTSKEPLGFAGGDTNLYVYSRNDAVNYVDPTGLACAKAGTIERWEHIYTGGIKEKPQYLSKRFDWLRRMERYEIVDCIGDEWYKVRTLRRKGNVEGWVSRHRFDSLPPLDKSKLRNLKGGNEPHIQDDTVSQGGNPDRSRIIHID